ncbi:hypothetical protein NFI00_000033 [Salmonella enterica]|nr:hypothetical protein [Salmonella enterica subsp. enterica serovar Minnesota]EJI5696330.1 hypothetical protein [Salmonella enterica]
MEKYKYLLGQTSSLNMIFVVLSSASSLSHEDLAFKLNITNVVSQGELLSTDPAFKLPESEAEHQAAVDTLPNDRFFTADVSHFGFGHHIYACVAEADEHEFHYRVRNMSWATLTESGFTFASPL